MKDQFRHYEKAKKQKLTAPINLLVSRKIRSSDHWGLSDPICKATRLCSLVTNMRVVLVDRDSDNNDDNDQTSTTRYARLRVQAVHSHERPQLWNSEGSVFGFWSGFSGLLCRFVWFFAIIIYFQNIDFNQNDCLPASLLCSLVTKGRQQRFPWGGHWTWLLWLGWCVITSFCIFYHHCGRAWPSSSPLISCHLHHKNDHRDHCNLMCKSVYLSFPLESSLSLCCWPGLLP